MYGPEQICIGIDRKTMQNTHLLAKALLDNVKLLVELLVDVVVVPDSAETSTQMRLVMAMGYGMGQILEDPGENGWLLCIISHNCWAQGL